jgi:CHASE2 domain-containing sensor protein
MESIRQLLETFQKLNTSAQVIVGIVAILIILGSIALFILAALLPTASVGIINLISILGGFAVGRVSKTS